MITHHHGCVTHHSWQVDRPPESAVKRVDESGSNGIDVQQGHEKMGLPRLAFEQGRLDEAEEPKREPDLGCLVNVLQFELEGLVPVSCCFLPRLMDI